QTAAARAENRAFLIISFLPADRGLDRRESSIGLPVAPSPPARLRSHPDHCKGDAVAKRPGNGGNSDVASPEIGQNHDAGARQHRDERDGIGRKLGQEGRDGQRRDGGRTGGGKETAPGWARLAAREKDGKVAQRPGAQRRQKHGVEDLPAHGHEAILSSSRRSETRHPAIMPPMMPTVSETKTQSRTATTMEVRITGTWGFEISGSSIARNKAGIRKLSPASIAG